MYLMESPPGPKTIINGKRVDYFCGTSYYCLQGHPEVIKAAREAVGKYGIGSATTRLGFGANPVLLEVEEKAAKFFNTEDALYYLSAYLGSQILLKGLNDQYDLIFVDEESHYSVLDGAFLANKPVVFFAHLDLEDLRKKIKQNIKPRQRPLVICDGIFPVSGEVSPITEYLKILEEYDRSIICVDDAHATGVIGDKGYGTFEYFGLDKNGLYSAGTFSKALGAHGGIIAADHEFIEHLRSHSEVLHATTPVPTPAAAAAAKALDILFENPAMRKKLWDNVKYAKDALRNLGFDVNETVVPIICLRHQDIDIQSLQLRLFEMGIAVHYLSRGSYSSVPKGGAIRIAIFSEHSKEQIDRLVVSIKSFI